MEIEDVYTFTGHGIVVTSQIERRDINLNDEVKIIAFRETRKTIIICLESNDMILDYT